MPLFQNKGETFTRLLALVMKPLLLVKDELVVKKGDIGQEMYFISHGTVEVINDDGTVVFARMHDGEFFGEVIFPPVLCVAGKASSLVRSPRAWATDLAGV